MKRYWKYIRPYLAAFICGPILMIVEVIGEVLLPKFMANIINVGAAQRNVPYIVSMGVVMILTALLMMLGGIGGAYFAAKAAISFSSDLRSDVFGKVQKFSFANLDKFSTAGLVTRLTTDVTNLQQAYQMLLRICFRAPISMICAMAMAYLINARLATVYLIALVLLAIVLFFIIKKAMKYFQLAFPKYDELNASVQENVSAIRVVKAYVREEYETSKLKKASQGIYDIFLKAERQVVLNMPVMQFTVYTCILLISWMGARMIVQSELTTGELMSLMTYCMNILMSLMMVAMIFVMMSMSIASARRISEVLNEKSDLANPVNPIYDVPSGDIEFRDVNFSYYEDGSKSVLHDINIKIKAGETVGILGGTGSSKTSLVNLISRLYDVSSGTVLVGGRDVREYDMDSLRNQVSVVLQKNVLFSGTILENLRWGNADASEEECRRVCRLACADEFVEKMPEGYHTYIEQGGSNVSGGQKQRLCIARALLKKPKVLILDDSTSAVDTATDAKIREAFAKEIPDTTKLIIAQRVSSVQHADHIILMENGKINGYGTHEELLRDNEIYREVYESQTSGGGDFDEKK